MTATAAQIGYGTQLKLGNAASPEVFTAISEEVEIGGLEITLPKVIATHLTSPNKKNEYVAGIGDFNTLEVKCNMTAANIAVIKNWVDLAAIANWKYVYPAPLSKTFEFSGVPESFKTGAVTPSGLLMVTFGITVSGDITLT